MVANSVMDVCWKMEEKYQKIGLTDYLQCRLLSKDVTDIGAANHLAIERGLLAHSQYCFTRMC
jgi:hypothetical protein